MGFSAAITAHAAEHGDRAALTARDRPGHLVSWTWRELDDVTGRIARRLRAAVAGSAVLAVDVDNSLRATALLVALLRTPHPLWLRSAHGPADGHRREVADRLAATGATVAAVTVDERGVPRTTVERPAARGARGTLPADAVVLHTGGTTGQAKLVVDRTLRRRPFQPPETRLLRAANGRPGQVQLVAGPLAHAASLTFFLEGLADGNHLVVQRRFDAAAALDLVRRWQVRWMQLTPFQMDRMSLALERAPGTSLSSIAALLHTAAPCPHRVKRFWMDRLGSERVFEMYGASEGIGVTLVRGDEWLRRPGTIGRGFWTQIRILDDRGRALPYGAVGTVYLRTGSWRHDSLALGPAAVTRTPDGFASVGDSGHVDAAGYLYLAPRRTDMINVGGEKVYPAEVERVLLEHHSVLDAVVVGRPDPTFGARPHAVVVLRDAGTTERDLKAHCRAALPGVKVPASIRIADSLPRTEAGKVRRAAPGRGPAPDTADPTGVPHGR